MLIVGLTGSIGMGKTTAARQLIRMGIPVHDADAAVHRQMARGGKAVAPIADAFPAAVEGGAVDRAALGRLVYEDLAALRRLEAIVHPLVRMEENRFLRSCARRRVPMVVLDIPLLFESGSERRMDSTIVVTAPAFIQTARVLKRPGMTSARLAKIRAQQMPDAEKCRRAEFVVRTGLGKAESLHALKRIVTLLSARRGRHWPPRPQPMKRRSRR